jgi:hypothetical protein
MLQTSSTPNFFLRGAAADDPSRLQRGEQRPWVSVRLLLEGESMF